MRPPVVALAPLPARITTRLPTTEVSSSPRSSPAGSVSVPAGPPAPLTMLIEPGTYVVPLGIGSRIVKPTASSWPVLVPVTLYSRMSPASTLPPLRSVTPFVWVILGAYNSVAKVITPGRYWSPEVVTLMFALVAPLGRMPSALMRSAS